MDLLRHLNSALSRGSGYERTPPGERFDPNAVRGYYLDFSAKTSTASAPSTLVPAGLAQLALGWWERGLVDPPAMERFREICGLLEAASVPDGNAIVWPYSVTVPKYRLRPPWLSALAQGQAASVFVRAFHELREDRYAALALSALQPLLDETPPSVVVRLPMGPVPEECPTHPPSLILNGWIYAIWALRDCSLAIGSDASKRMYDATVSCLLESLPRYDIGWWSRYSLFPHRVPDLAKIFYHRLHVDQLQVMGRITGESSFTETAERWRSYDTPLNRTRATAQKAVFVASGYR